MHSKWIIYMAVAIAAATVFAEARRVILSQLTADQVYTILKAADREDAVPEGRVVTQGIAALSGFGLGIAKGVGGSILNDVATSNFTLEWLNSLNLTSLLPGKTVANVTGIKQITEEICFSTRSNSMESDVVAEGRQATTTNGTTTPTNTGTSTPTTLPTPSSPTTPTGTTSPTPSPTPSPGTTPPDYTSPTTASPTTSPLPIPSPVPMPSPTLTPGPTLAPSPTASPSPSAIPTPALSPTDGEPTCIVIQKPTIRRRRSVRRKRLLAH